MAEYWHDPSKQRDVVIAGKIVGLASMLGSGYIVHSIVGTGTSRREKLKTTFHRFLLFLSVFDILSSFGYFIGTWMVPALPPEGMQEVFQSSPAMEHYDYHIAFPWAAGNAATCTLQGMLIHVGMIGSCFFTGFLSLHYVLSVRCKWSPQKTKRMEIICCTLGTSLPIGSAIYLAAADLFNPVRIGVYWINQYPIVCNNYDYGLDPTANGTHEAYCDDNPDLVSDESVAYAMLLGIYPALITVFLIVVVSMVLLYRTIREQELKVAHWSQAAQDGRYTKQAIQRAMLLIGNFLIMYVPAIVASFLKSYSKAGFLVTIVFMASQGVLNALVYSGVAEWFLALPNRLGQRCRAQFRRATNLDDEVLEATEEATLDRTWTRVSSTSQFPASGEQPQQQQEQSTGAATSTADHNNYNGDDEEGTS